MRRVCYLPMLSSLAARATLELATQRVYKKTGTVLLAYGVA